MSKSWSSFEGQQLLHENWRNFLSEESETAKYFRDRGYEVEDRWEDAEEPEENPQASDYPDVSHGLTSDDNKESLKQVLTPILDAPQIQTLIDVIAQIAGDEGIMLELSLKGLNSEQDRIIDSAGTALILKAIAGFNLPDAKNTALIKALNYWGRVNSVKFTAPPAAAPAVVNTTDARDDVSQTRTATSDEPTPEPSATATPSKDKMSLWQRLDNARNLAEYGEVYEKIRKILNPDGNTWEEIMGELQSGGPEHASTAISAFGEDRDENNRSHHQIKFIELATAHQQDQFDNPPDEEEDTSDEPTESDETKETKVLSMIGSGLDVISAAGVFPPAEATFIPTGATLASLGLNLYQKKMGWALMDLIALVPWAGKFTKASSLAKIAKTAAATGKTGKALASATKAMKLADPAFKATKLVKGAIGVHKILYELVPEEMIRTAVYAKTNDGKKYYIDFVLKVLGYIPNPIIMAGVGELKETVAWIRKDLGGPEPETPTDQRDLPPERSRGRRTTPRIGTQIGGNLGPLQETYDRWQTIAGINQRVL